MKNTAAIRRPNFAACRRRAYIRTNHNPFPNAARAGYFLEKVLDGALAAATTLAVVVILLFVVTVF
ncbi:MAG: hypothetical protein IKC09_05230 [Oscillospiraceae bacterium]|nr:hypothetical protein [Oscillospiraceae bacterium]